MRTFIAIEIPEKARQVVWHFIQGQKNKNLPIKWVEFENLHITLKFLGEIKPEKLDDLVSLLVGVSSKTKKFFLSLKDLGCFPGIRNPRVLWIGVAEGAEELNNLATIIDNDLTKLGIKKEEKKFHPHLTIGRIKAPCPVADIINQPLTTERFEVSEFILFKSTLTPSGPIYEKIKVFPLI